MLQIVEDENFQLMLSNRNRSISTIFSSKIASDNESSREEVTSLVITNYSSQERRVLVKMSLRVILLQSFRAIVSGLSKTEMRDWFLISS